MGGIWPRLPSFVFSGLRNAAFLPLPERGRRLRVCDCCAPLTLLHRINPERNERRFYAVQVGPSLFDEHAVLRLWGRIGGYQRQMVTPCPSPDDAQALARQLIQRRLQHGYQILKGGNPLD